MANTNNTEPVGLDGEKKPHSSGPVNPQTKQSLFGNKNPNYKPQQRIEITDENKDKFKKPVDSNKKKKVIPDDYNKRSELMKKDPFYLENDRPNPMLNRKNPEKPERVSLLPEEADDWNIPCISTKKPHEINYMYLSKPENKHKFDKLSQADKEQVVFFKQIHDETDAYNAQKEKKKSPKNDPPPINNNPPPINTPKLPPIGPKPPSPLDRGSPKKEKEPDTGHEASDLLKEIVEVSRDKTLFWRIIESSLDILNGFTIWRKTISLGASYLKNFLNRTFGWNLDFNPEDMLGGYCASFVFLSIGYLIWKSFIPTYVVKLVQCETEEDEDFCVKRHPNNQLTNQTADYYHYFKYCLFLRFTIHLKVNLFSTCVNKLSCGRVNIPMIPDYVDIKIPISFVPKSMEKYTNMETENQGKIQKFIRKPKMELVACDILQRVTNTATLNLINGIEGLHNRVQNAINSNTDACLANKELHQSSVNGTVNYLSYTFKEMQENNPNTNFQRGANNPNISMGIESSTLDLEGDPRYRIVRKLIFTLLILIELKRGWEKCAQFNVTWVLQLKDSVCHIPTLPIRLVQYSEKLREATQKFLFCNLLKMGAWVAERYQSKH